MEIAEQDISSESRHAALSSLAGIGSAAKAAVPSLLRWVTNADPVCRYEASFALFVIDEPAAAKAGLSDIWPRYSRRGVEEEIAKARAKAMAGLTNRVR